MNAECKKERKSSRVKLLVFLLLLIFLLLGIVIGVNLMRGKKYDNSKTDAHISTEKAGGGVELVIDPNAEKSLPIENDNILEQGVVITGRESLTFSANTKEESVDFINPEENAQLYYLTFELRLYNSNGRDYEVLYTSGLVEPGKRINRITLSRELEKGVYEAVVHVQPYRMNKEKTLTNNVDMRIKLFVN